MSGYTNLFHKGLERAELLMLVNKHKCFKCLLLAVAEQKTITKPLITIYLGPGLPEGPGYLMPTIILELLRVFASLRSPLPNSIVSLNNRILKLFFFFKFGPLSVLFLYISHYNKQPNTVMHSPQIVFSFTMNLS